MKNYHIHIGELILQKLKKEKRSVAWLAGEVFIDPSNLRKVLKKKSMDTSLLQRISKALQYNFFYHYTDIVFEDETGNMR
ncbi:MAG: XRE family transcriptional regulator [Bacteroidetes bacterium]|nr:XRE family transcriptional regulator [Bacteroidota bacterium]MCL2302133.1 XRE family transcriptional regulator [Lentimicrobiaceae bacterium]